MKISKLTIKNFRRFNDKAFDLSDGVNVIRGLNEAGKSTLSEAILALLFADPTTKSKQFFDKFGSWEQGGSIFLQAEGTARGGRFRLTKDFGLKVAKLENLDNKKETSDIKAVEKSISQLLGIASGRVFEASAFVRQSDLAKIDSSEDLIAAIQSAASSGGVESGVGKIIKEIDKELLDLKKGLDRPTNAPGKIKDTENRLTQLKRNYEEMKSKWEKVKNAAGQSKDSKGALSEAREKISLIEKQLEYNKKNKEATEEIKKIEQQIVRLERKLGEVKETSTQIVNINASIGHYEKIKSVDLEKVAREITEITGVLKNKKSSLERMKEEAGEREKEKSPTAEKFDTNKLVLPLIVGLISAVAYFALSRIEILIGGLVVTFGLLVYSLTRPAKKDERKDEAAERLEQTTALEDQIAKEEKLLDQKLLKLGAKDTDDFYTKKAKLKSLLDEKTNIESLQKGMLEGKTIDEIKDEQAKLLAAKKEIETNVLTEDVKNSDLTSEEYLKRRRELDSLKMEERRLVQLEAASSVRVEDADVSVDDIVQMEEEVERLEEDLGYYTKKRKVLELARETIELAVEDTAKDAGKIIKEFVKEFLSKITGGRYEEVKVGKDLGIEVFSKEKGDWVDPVGNLSSGTVDQIYFLIRLAILDMVAGDAHPLIILDDPFVTFDKARKEVTKEILSEISKKHQVLLLTHHEEYEGWGKTTSI